MREYKKSYTPLILWSIVLTPAMVAAGMLSESIGMNDRSIVAVSMLTVIVMLLVLMWIIWKGEYVYWINGGPSFEQAKAVGSEKRRDYAWRHFAAILKGSAIALVLLTAEYFLKAHVLVMILSTAVCIIAAAISTARIKW